MNSKERFMSALKLEQVDRPPVAAVVTGVTVPMMQAVDIHYPRAHHDAVSLAGLAESVWTVSGIECIKLPFGMTVEVEVFGAPIDFGTYDTLPTEVSHIFNHPDELTLPKDFFDLGRVPVVLEAIGELRKKYDQEVAIVSSIVGPFALGAKLFGFDNLFPWIITNPDYVHRILEKLTRLAIDYANAQAEAGADVILIGEATCSGDLISPNTYQDFIVPYHIEICAAINGPTILHICGNSSYHLPFIAQTGATGYSFDEGVDMVEARKHLKGKVALAGYVPTVEVLLQGTPEMAYQASLECLANGVDILTPGCSLPQHTTLENVEQMHRAVSDWVGKHDLREKPPQIIDSLKPGFDAESQDGPGTDRHERKRMRRRSRRRG
jgi:MtaA/CmuA family methyltransferase